MLSIYNKLRALQTSQGPCTVLRGDKSSLARSQWSYQLDLTNSQGVFQVHIAHVRVVEANHIPSMHRSLYKDAMKSICKWPFYIRQ